MPKTYDHLFAEISSFQRLRRSFYSAARRKFSRAAVLHFSHKLEDNLFEISEKLKDGSYPFGPYRAFYVTEPKLRLIESACFRDRVVHHSIHETLEPIFDAQFSEYSYACRTGRGHHKAMLKLHSWVKTQPQKYFLKCDIKKFFPSIDRETLLLIIGRTILDPELMQSLRKLILNAPNTGIPIGNLTSQLFANVYLNELDQYVKRRLRIKNYIRYMDDFILITENFEDAKALRMKIEVFLSEKLKLKLSPQKVLIGKCEFGISFLGFVITPRRISLRGKVFRKMKRKLEVAICRDLAGLTTRHVPSPYLAAANSYLGHIRFCTNYEYLREEICKLDLGFMNERRGDLG